MKYWVVLRKERDIWVSHILDLDFVTQGDNIPNVLEMTRDLLEMFQEDKDFFPVKRADDEDLLEFGEILLSGRSLPIESISEDSPGIRVALLMGKEGETCGTCWVSDSGTGSTAIG